MQAIVLCGGRGERLMPLTARTPAPLLRIAGKEVILYQLSQLEKSNISEITLALGYGGDKIKSFFSAIDKNLSEISFSECEAIGTATAIEKAYNKLDDNFIVIEGNCVFDCDIKSLINYHNDKNSLCTLLVRKADNDNENAFVKVDDNGKVCGILSQTSNHTVAYDKALSGICIVNKKVFDEIPFVNGLDFVNDILPKIISDCGEVYALEKEFDYHKILTPYEFISCQGKILYKNRDKIISKTDSNFNGVTILPPCYIGKNVTIESGTVIEKGAVIDDDAVIKQRSRINGGYVGKNAVLKPMCEIEKAVICQNVCLEKGVKCGEYSVVGESSHIGENSEISSVSKVWAERKIQSNTIVNEKYFTGNFKQGHIDEDGWYTICDTKNTVLSALKLGQAVASAFNIGDKIVIGYTAEQNAVYMHNALKSGLAAGGIDVLDVGECTLTQLMYSSFFCNAEAGIFIKVNTHCAMNIFAKNGILLERQTELDVEKAYENESFRTCDFSDYGVSMNSEGAKLAYESYIKTYCNRKFAKLNCEIRAYDKATAGLSDRIFRPLNSLNGERIVFHISDDGKKCSAYSDLTGNVSWEKLSALGIYIAFEKKLPVAVPVTYPTSADTLAENSNGRLYRFYNCSCGKMDLSARRIAQRADNLFMRDGVVLCAMICAYINDYGLSFNEVLKMVPDIYSTQRFVSFSGDYSKIFKAIREKNDDGNEGAVVRDKNSKAVVRPLKNGNGIMIFAESKSCEMAAELCDNLSEKIKRLQTP